MTHDSKPAPEQIREARQENPDMRERDFARDLGISEADYIAAHVGADGPLTARRILPFARELLGLLPKLGEVMSLTRNDSAVHETIGTFGRFMSSGGAAAAFGDNINLRLFFRHWAHGFAVEKRDNDTDTARRSLQFFDPAGEAVQKIHLRPESDLIAFEALVTRLISPDQSQTVVTAPYPPAPEDAVTVDNFARRNDLRELWTGMTDVHQFWDILQKINVPRRVAVHCVGEDCAWPLASDAIGTVLGQVSASGTETMCFVGSRGCTQIYGGPISTVRPMGPWLNVMDPRFHLHLRTDHIAEVWALRRPIAEGQLSSVEAYDAQGRLVIQFFGARQNGQDEPAEWRAIVDALERRPHPQAA